MWNDFTSMNVLVTGGTRGVGLATGLAFGRRGAHVTLTHKWGSADEDAIRRQFAQAGATDPSIVEADVSHAGDTAALMAELATRCDRLDVLVSNSAFGALARTFAEYDRNALARTMDYSTWPVVEYTRRAKEAFGRWPRYVVAVSSEGSEAYHINYDLVAAAKAALEALCRYMHARLRGEGVNVNVVRTRFVSTELMRATFGDEFEPFVERHAPGLFSPAADVGEAIVGVCSGLMDGMGGQVIAVDGGANVCDNFSSLFSEGAFQNNRSEEK